MISEGALLGLIIDDTEALAVLAAWGALECPLAVLYEKHDGSTIEQLAMLTKLHPAAIPFILQRLKAARVLVEGGISEMADKMMQTRVSNALGGKKVKK